MEPVRIKQIIHEYLNLVLRSEKLASGAESALRSILDQLAAAVSAAPLGNVTSDKDAPDTKYDMEAIGKRFPGCGLYQAAGLLEAGKEPGLLVGDAIDDIADIARDLDAVAWTWDNIGESDALWVLHQTFSSHWGTHLRCLQWYLHEIRD